MQPNNLTALDFNDIKESIKAYLRTRTEFSDYDFQGSSLSYMIDILAYNTYYTAFNANMAVNEAFLTSATVRDNIVNIAKLLNYVPRSPISATLCAGITIQTAAVDGVFPSTATINKGAAGVGGSFVWNRLSDLTVEVDPSTGIADFGSVKFREGNIVKFSYVVNTFQNQTYKIPSSQADLTTLIVKVKPNEASTTSDTYVQVDNVTGLTSTSRVYFLSEGEDMRYELKFGDDSIGRSLKDGEVIELEYLVTQDDSANEVNEFNFNGRITDSNGSAYSASRALIGSIMTGYGGTAPESIESIKYNAPRYYSAQYRAVAAQDYAILTKKVYDNARSVVAYGGDSLNPPIYGKVFIAVQTKTGSTLNDSTKKQIASNLRQYAMASIDPVIIDPENIYIYNKIFIQYDTGCGDDTTTIKSDVQKGINDWAQQTEINNFNSTFRAQQLEKAISLSSKCVSDVSMQTTILRYVKPTTNQTNTYVIATGAGLYNSAPSLTDSTNATKEPILLSGTYRTADRPGVDQQFEDDGFGNLRQFYNTGTRKVITNSKAGTVNYDTGEIAFGPVAIIGTGTNVASTGVNITNTVSGEGSITDPAALPANLQIPVQFIPSNSSTIPASTPGTIINIISPEVTVAPIGTTPPASIPLNSLTPTTFDQTPSTVTVADLQNGGNLNTSECI